MTAVNCTADKVKGWMMRALTWIVLIVGGAVYLLYRSLWKKKSYCTGCDTSGKC